jgi:hypothetical protein
VSSHDQTPYSLYQELDQSKREHTSIDIQQAKPPKGKIFRETNVEFMVHGSIELS